MSRSQDGERRIIATGSYHAKDARTAEVALAVADAFQGKGLGTLLLEQLALLAVRDGFTHLWAVTHADNRAMQEVIRESGFAFAEKPDRGEVEVDLSVVPSASTVARLRTRHRVATVASLRPFFRPKAVAVVGASRDPAWLMIVAPSFGLFRSGSFPGDPVGGGSPGLGLVPLTKGDGWLLATLRARPVAPSPR